MPHPMRTPAALPCLAPAPLLLATALGAAGFGAGWLFRSGAVDVPAAAPAPREEVRSTAAREPLSHEATQPTQAGPAATRASPSGPAPAVAKARLAAWVAAGCPRGDVDEITGLLEAWSRAEPWEALAFIHGAPQFRGRTDAYQIPLGMLAAESPAAALGWMQRELPDPSMRKSVAEDVIHCLIRDHPQAAFEIARAELPSRSYLFSNTYGRLADTDPAAALAWFGRFSAEERGVTVAELAQGWLAADRLAATTWCLAQGDQPHAAGAVRALVEFLIRNDPAAVSTLLADPSIALPTRLFAVHRLGSSDPAIALELLPSLPRKEAASAFASMFDSLFSEDPASAIDLGRSLLTADALARHVCHEWRRWTRSDPAGAQAWAAALADPELRRQIDTEKRTQAVRHDPAAYLASAAPRPGDAEAAQMINLAISTLTEDDPAEAARWFARHTDVAEPNHARRIARRLMTTGVEPALAWVQTLPTGPARDAAHVALIEAGATRDDTAPLVQLLEQLGDPVLQVRTRFQAYCIMHERDPAGATRWLEQQPLPPDVRTSWLAIVRDDAREIITCELPDIY